MVVYTNVRIFVSVNQVNIFKTQTMKNLEKAIYGKMKVAEKLNVNVSANKATEEAELTEMKSKSFLVETKTTINSDEFMLATLFSRIDNNFIAGVILKNGEEVYFVTDLKIWEKTFEGFKLDYKAVELDNVLRIASMK